MAKLYIKKGTKISTINFNEKFWESMRDLLKNQGKIGEAVKFAPGFMSGFVTGYYYT